ncbi:hypothetical protein P7K49_032075 [Saguinus oedipus]|uniref:Uncharacterized protein n=1 Tax=Saguinus oedipus TaxID=9490 RepID=A0ABQ9TY08_SAGOE|nr:hypothetical protein P7K49_032075 [Saguinus oedipus]
MRPLQPEPQRDPARNSLDWVPCLTSNLRFGRADFHVHLIEQDVDNEPHQEFPGKRDLSRCSGQRHGRSHGTQCPISRLLVRQ